MVSSFLAFVRCGVAQCDVRLQNMIMTSDETKKVFIVYVDFAKAEPSDENQVILDASLSVPFVAPGP
jgi:hypothetical protein